MYSWEVEGLGRGPMAQPGTNVEDPQQFDIALILTFSTAQWEKGAAHHCVLPAVIIGKSSVRNGEAGRPAPLYKLHSGLLAHP